MTSDLDSNRILGGCLLHNLNNNMSARKNDYTHSDNDLFRNLVDDTVAKLSVPFRSEQGKLIGTLFSHINVGYDGLITGLTLPDPTLRIAAIWLLGKLQYKPAASSLLALIRNKSEALDVRWEATTALANLTSKRPVLPLLKTVRENPDEDSRAMAAYVLGWLRDRRAIEVLTDKVQQESESTRVRAQSAEALGHLALSCAEVSESVPVLISILDDRNPEVRYWTAFALGNIKDARALDKLHELSISDHTLIPTWGTVAEEALEAVNFIRSTSDLDQASKA